MVKIGILDDIRVLVLAHLEGHALGRNAQPLEAVGGGFVFPRAHRAGVRLTDDAGAVQIRDRDVNGQRDRIEAFAAHAGT